jgi:hypothetical protein
MAIHDPVTVSRDDVQAIIDWWRHCNEAPGGCSFKEAIAGMHDAVVRLNATLREIP